MVQHCLIEVLVRGDRNAQKHIRMPCQELGRRVNHHVSTEGERLLQNWGGEGVIDRSHHAQTFRRRANSGQVGDLKHGVRGALQPGEYLRSSIIHGFGGYTGAGSSIFEGGDHRSGIFQIDAHDLSNTAFLQILTHSDRGHVGMFRNENNRPDRYQIQNRGNRCHARRE